MANYTSIPSRIPYVLQLAFLLAMAILAGGIFQMLGAILSQWIFGISDIFEFLKDPELQKESPSALILTQGFAALGTFILPALLFPLVVNDRPKRIYQWRDSVHPFLIILVLGIAYFINPLIQISSELNEAIRFPDLLKEVEAYLIQTHEQIQQAYNILLNIDSTGQLILLLLVVAVIPAIGEELIFRGALQTIMQNWTKNAHLGIWIAAILFSAFHMQFYLFLPRMILGVIFGYLLFWSGNMWYPVIAHFINNASVIMVAYFYKLNDKVINLEEAGEMSLIWSIPLIIVLFLLLFLFRKYALNQRQIDGPEEMDQNIQYE